MVDSNEDVGPMKDDLFGDLRDKEMWSQSSPLPTIEELRARNARPSVRLEKAASRLLESAGFGHNYDGIEGTSKIGAISHGQVTGNSYTAGERTARKALFAITATGLGVAAYKAIS